MDEWVRWITAYLMVCFGSRAGPCTLEIRDWRLGFAFILVSSNSHRRAHSYRQWTRTGIIIIG